MRIGRISSVSSDGVTVALDTDTEQMVAVRIPVVPIGTRFEEDADGVLRVVYPTKMDKRARERLEESEAFYHDTKDFLPYRDYAAILSKYPNAHTKYLSDPYFLTRLVRSEDSERPYALFPAVDASCKVRSFDAKLSQMRAAISYVLTRNESEGNTWMPYADLSKKVRAILEKGCSPLLRGEVSQYLSAFSEEFHTERGEDCDDLKVSFAQTFFKERTIYRAILRLAGTPCPYTAYNPCISEDYSPAQALAIREIVPKGGLSSILTGGPGTG